MIKLFSNENLNMRRGEFTRPKFRKNSLRLKDWDYSQAGPYFFTICTFKRKNIFKNQSIQNKVIGIFNILAYKLRIKVNAVIVADNHIHGILTLPDDKSMKLWNYIAIVKVKITQTIDVNNSKKTEGQVNLPLREKIWQRSFYDHIIRDEKDYFEKAQYIENHPIKEEGSIYAEWH